MTSVVTSSGQLEASEPVKKRVHIAEGPSGSLDVSSAQKNILSGLTPGGEFPSTAELMHKCMAVNPFEAKFAEANRRMTGGMSGTLESNGLVPPSMSLTTVNPPGSSLLKFNSLSQSPGIFSNISILTTDVDGGNENLKTADISKLLNLQQACGDIGQAPRTADVLNSVLDMHQAQDRLHTVNYLSKDITSIFSSLTPSGSAPNSAGILGLVATSITPATLPSTSGGLLSVPLVTASPAHSPRQAPQQFPQDPRQERLPEKQRSPNVSEGTSAGGVPTLLTTLHSQADWDPRDVKPQVSQLPPKPRINFFEHDGVGAMAAGGSGMPTVAIPGESSLMQLEALPKSEPSPTTSVGRGRGRGRAAAELPADERSFRMTILERNKAAAVRYRKRKKEEHDDMIGRVHGLEQEKAQLATQNQVLRQELERVTALLRQREVGCHCMKGRLPLSTDIRSADSPIDVDILPQHGMYIPQAAQLINGLGMPNGLGLKRPTKM